ncbi:hypothetical protein GJAV_G00015590 [Gymnothorax javanicus]|nr:hypothetical protein GJAV_G00015590 [Gymnothorax javanicus]
MHNFHHQAVNVHRPKSSNRVHMIALDYQNYMRRISTDGGTLRTRTRTCSTGELRATWVTTEIHREQCSCVECSVEQ